VTVRGKSYWAPCGVLLPSYGHEYSRPQSAQIYTNNQFKCD
jgi:hypothetical protein